MGNGDLDKATVNKLTLAIKDLETNNKQTQRLLSDLDSKLDKKDASTKGGSSRSSYGSSRSSRSFSDALGDLQDAQAFTLGFTDFIEASVLKYGGLIDYGTSQLENRASIAIKLQAERLTEFALDTEKFIGSKSISMVFGSAAAAREELAKIYDANSFYLNRIAEDYADSDDAGLEVMANSLIIQKALRINQEDFSKIIENQMASSKKVTSEVFEEIAFIAGEYSNRTTASLFQITNQLTRAVGDFDTFGGASVENLGKLAGFMGQLKMDTSSIAGLVKRLQSFEGSVDIVRDLAGAFGAVIDPAKLMGDAINDPAEALNTIRQALLDAGHTSDSLGFKITLIADKFGVSSEQMRRFLNAEVDAQSVLQNSVKMTEMTAEKTNKVVSDANKQIVDRRTVAETIADTAKDALEMQLGNTFLQVRDFQSNFNQFISSQGNALAKLFGDSKTVEKAGEAFNKLMYGTDKQKKEGQEYLTKILSAEGLGEKAKKQADELRKVILGEDNELNIDMKTVYKQVDDIKAYYGEKGGITVTTDIDEQGMSDALLRASKSPGLETFKKEMNKPFDYTRTHSNSEFMDHLDENFNYLNAILKRTTAKNQPLDKFDKKMKGMGVIDVKLKDESGEITLDELSKKTKAADKGVPDMSQNNELIREIRLMRDDLKNTKYVANITNDANYNIVLGEDFKSQVRAIADKVVEEAFTAAGFIPKQGG